MSDTIEESTYLSFASDDIEVYSGMNMSFLSYVVTKVALCFPV